MEEDKNANRMIHASIDSINDGSQLKSCFINSTRAIKVNSRMDLGWK